jgi:N4-gp56 family major capsid protein
VATTTVTSGGTLSVIQYQGEKLAAEARKIDILASKGMVGKTASSIIQEIDDAEKGKGDSITYYLRMKGVGPGVDGDGTLEGNEESLVFYSDSIYLGQKRHAFRLDGLLTEQRTKIKLRQEAREALAVWFGEFNNELAITMLSGAAGTNGGILGTGFASFGGNSLVVPDSTHLVYANSANTKAGMTAADVLTLNWVDKLVASAQSMSPQVAPAMIDGQELYVLVVSPYQARDLRTNTNSGQWLDIQKAAMAGGSVSNNPIFKGQNVLGMYNGVLILVSQDVRTFSDYGGGSVAAARALFLGRQAGVRAYGQGNSAQYRYVEETFDYANQTGFAGACIFAIKPVIFNSKRLGMIALDTAAAA